MSPENIHETALDLLIDFGAKTPVLHLTASSSGQNLFELDVEKISEIASAQIDIPQGK